MEWMARNDAACEQVEGQPAPFVFMIGLILQRLGRERLSHVFSGDEPCFRNNLSNRLDRPLDRQALVDQRAEGRVDVGEMRIPMSVEARKARRGHRLVD